MGKRIKELQAFKGKSLSSGPAVTPESELQGNGGSRRMPRGTKRMRQFGYKRLELWLDKTERELIEEYCRFAGKAMATWVRRLAFETAAAELTKAGKRKGGEHGS